MHAHSAWPCACVRVFVRLAFSPPVSPSAPFQTHTKTHSNLLGGLIKAHLTSTFSLTSSSIPRESHGQWGESVWVRVCGTEGLLHCLTVSKHWWSNTLPPPLAFSLPLPSPYLVWFTSQSCSNFFFNYREKKVLQWSYVMHLTAGL